jgi:hypothetical protein
MRAFFAGVLDQTAVLVIDAEIDPPNLSRSRSAQRRALRGRTLPARITLPGTATCRGLQSLDGK